MKKLILLIVILYSTSFSAQSNNIVDQKFYVNGKCDMCQDRIENILEVKGVKLAEWDIKTKICRIVYRKDKISEDQIHQLLADGGHDTKKVRASDKAYNNLHHCCHYKRE